MFLIYTLYDYVLGEKSFQTQLKNASQSENYLLQIVVPSRKFLGLPFGGGFMKVARVYDYHGKEVRSKYYSEELKEEIHRFKKEFTIPHYQLWKGVLYAAVIIFIVALVVNFNNKKKMGELKDMQEHARTSLQQLKPGQKYGVSFFTDKDGNSINGLPDGWILINKVEGDTVFVQRSKQTLTGIPLFEMDKIASIKPQSAEEWESKIEKVNYPLLKDQLTNPDKEKFDLLYIGSDKDRYSGVCFTIKGAE